MAMWKKIRSYSYQPMYLMIIFLLVISYGLGIPLLETQLFDQDEFWHLHSAWSISKGLLPYRDYFEIHTPLYYFSLAPFFSFFNVEKDVGDALAFIFFSRGLMWLLTGVVLSLTFWLGKLWRDARIALVGTLFLINTQVFWARALEIRPDALATACWLACLAMIVRAVQFKNTCRFRIHWQFAWSGIFLGVGAMVVQKIVFVLPGLAVAMFWYLLDHHTHGTRRVRLQNVGYQIVGFCVPIVLTLIYFYLHDSLLQFVRYNFFAPSGFFKSRVTPYHDLHQLIIQNPYLALLGGAGLVRFLLPILRRDSFGHKDFILWSSTVGVIGGAVFLMPVPHTQVYLMFLPLIALFAGAFFIESVDKLMELRERLHAWQWSLMIVLIALAVMTSLGLMRLGTELHWRSFIVSAYWFSALLGGIVLISLRARSFALTFFLVAISIPALYTRYTTLHDFPQRNTAQLEEIQYIIENTAPADTVMDGYRGSSVFRPNAYFYSFLPWSIRQMLTDKDWHELLKNLYSGQIAPKLIIFDKNLQDLSLAITAFFEEHYQPVGKGAIWQRKEGK